MTTLRSLAPTGPFAHYPSLRGRRVLISGGASGIGAALVRGFVAQGSAVAFVDVQDEAAAALMAELSGERGATSGVAWDAAGVAPIYRHCDLSDASAIPDAVADCIRWLGGLDVLVNNAGNDRRHASDTVSVAEWDELTAINLRQQFFVTQAALPALRQSGAASVLHMSSIAWRIPSVGLPAYVAAKAGIVGLARSLAFEEGKHNIRVNSIQPGAILTEKQKQLWVTPEYSAEILSRQAIRRHLEPEEVVRLALFLASDDSSGMTGQSYVIDGGWV